MFEYDPISFHGGRPPCSSYVHRSLTELGEGTESLKLDSIRARTAVELDAPPSLRLGTFLSTNNRLCKSFQLEVATRMKRDPRLEEQFNGLRNAFEIGASGKMMAG
jgi:hypothetical protein